MQETPMILSECNEINCLLYKPIIATQRIKYTCLNVSEKYIALGSTSGSLYLFTREPCIFQQLIPLSEGPVSCVVISPDEKTIAISTKRGSVCLIALKPSVKLLAMSNEHLGELVTSLCWNDNSSEIYIGDGIGKISTMFLSKFLVNGIFQPPNCALMHLDSTIVQMNFSSNRLLVSTMTRCYICDTAQEQFKQIGNKARDGEFGACFLLNPMSRDKSPSRASKVDDKNSSRKGTFNLISEPNGVSRDDESMKIYCARPGCRLWEVTANGVVVKTHQFKEALAIPPSNAYKTSMTKLNGQNGQNEQITISQTINFSHLYVVCKKYLMSYTSSGLYIIDPTNTAVILWNNEYANIAIARTIGDRIYLMTDTGVFHCLTLSSPESLVLQLYEKKRYNDALRACNTLRPELLKTISGKDTIQNGEIDSIDNGVAQNNEITATLVSLISLIQSNLNAQPVKLNSGIVVVNAGNNKARIDALSCGEKPIVTINSDVNNCRDEESIVITEIDPVICDNVAKKKETKSMEPEELLVSSNDNYSVREESLENGKSIEDSETPVNEENRNEIDDITANIQTDLSPVYTLINQLKPSMTDSELEDIIINVRNTISDINENYGKIVQLKDFLYEVLRSTERHYYNVLLDSTTTEYLDTTTNDCVINEVVKAFVDINLSNVTECTCGYNYPKGQLNEPKFLNIGRSLLKRFAKESSDNCIKLSKNVPYIWREYLPMCIGDSKILDEILCTCLQTRDDIVLSIVLPALDEKQWKVAVKCLKNIENDICLSCGVREESQNLGKKLRIDWSGVAREMIKREGPTVAMNFLLQIERHCPYIKIDKSIFQSLIFTKILAHHGLKHPVEFDRESPGNSEYEAMCSPKVQEQLVESLEKDLDRAMDQKVFGVGPHHWGQRFQTKSSTCPCCTLSLQTPVLLGNNGISIFPCGHAYHVNCLIQRKFSRCILHS